MVWYSHWWFGVVTGGVGGGRAVTGDDTVMSTQSANQ